MWNLHTNTDDSNHTFFCCHRFCDCPCFHRDPTRGHQRKTKELVPEMRVRIYWWTVLVLILITIIMFFFMVSLFTEQEIPRTEAKEKIPSLWTWECEKNRCVKRRKASDKAQQSLNVCKTLCGPTGALWPLPTGKVTLGMSMLPFSLQQVTFQDIQVPNPGIGSLISDASEIFRGNIQRIAPFDEAKGAVDVSVEVSVNSDESYLTLSTLENYTLSVSRTKKHKLSVEIEAETFFGARHALETLSQLITYDDVSNRLQIVDSAFVSDSPVYPYRGLLLDTSRNFFSVVAIKRTLDAMAANKLNTFHWHITDSHSFPFQSAAIPQMAEWGAYSPDKVYTPEDISELVEYARVRGVRIVPELDAPAHAGNGWQWGEVEGKGKLSLCINEVPWGYVCGEPPCGQLNPVNNYTYKVLHELYKEMQEVFKSDIFHMGGDEVNYQCWMKSDEIMAAVNLTHNYKDWTVAQKAMTDIWGKFQDRALKSLIRASGGKKPVVMLWTSKLTEPSTIADYLDKDTYVLQMWGGRGDPSLGLLMEKGYRVILSNVDAWYLDCGFGSWRSGYEGACNPYSTWMKVYDNNPDAIMDSHNVPDKGRKELMLGGEACLWSEQVDEFSLDTRMWPRGAALAERLWSNPKGTAWEAHARMGYQRQLLVSRGISADAVSPEWCYQNAKECV